MTVHESALGDGKYRGACQRLGLRCLSVGMRSCTYVLVILAFAVGSTFFYCFTWVRTLMLEPTRSRRVTRSIIHSGVRLLFRVIEVLGLLRVIEEDEDADACYHGEMGVIVANHPSMLDALFFLSRFPQVVCVMKSSLLKLPVLGGFARAAGYLPYDETPELWQRAKEAYDEGACILVFPEGTRSPALRIGEFKRGAARLAIELGAPLLPYVLEMNPLVLTRDSAWWCPPAQTVVLRVKRLPRVDSHVVKPGEAVGRTSDDNRRESVRLTEYLEVLIHSSLSSPKE